MSAPNPSPLSRRVKAGAFLSGVAPVLCLALLLLNACGSELAAEPRELLLAPEDIAAALSLPGSAAVSVLSLSEEESLDGPSAQMEAQGPGLRVLQSIVLFDTREQALAALDGIRADLVNRGEAGPGGPEASGVFEHTLGGEEAASLFFIENRALVRLTVTGPGRAQRLSDLADAARDRIPGG